MGNGERPIRLGLALGMDEQRVSAVSEFHETGGRARRIQREIYDKSNGSARRERGKAARTQPQNLSKLFSAEFEVAVHGNSPNKVIKLSCKSNKIFMIYLGILAVQTVLMILTFEYSCRFDEQFQWSKLTLNQRIILSIAFASLIQFLIVTMIPGWLIAVTILGYKSIDITAFENEIFGIIMVIANTIERMMR